jgi:NAD-dependent DNA ligase
MRSSPEVPRSYYAAQLDSRVASELLGVAKGVVFDRVVNLAEMEALSRWLDAHPEAHSAFPGREIAARLLRIYADGVVAAEEQAELRAYLEALTGSPTNGTGAAADRSTAAPLDRPPPAVIFADRKFVLTGGFAFGTRGDCEGFIRSLGGVIQSNVSDATDYLVVGALGSDAWITSSYGRKIEAAAERKSAGLPIAIVAEAHWLEQARRSDGAA